jgi:iron complex outermembrane receptor protein
LFLTKGRGYYEQYKASARFSSYGLPNAVFGTTTISRTDLVRQLWLDNDFYGQLLSLQYKKEKNLLTFGGGWNNYEGKHFGEVIWAAVGIPKNYRWYDLDARKSDKNIYTKWQHDINNQWQFFSDIQYRSVDYKINGFRNNPTVKVDRSFNFFNPKAGISFMKNGLQAYLSYALANKEPNRDDFEAAASDQPLHETLHNVELGVTKRKTNFSYGANAYYMYYNNQLVLNGKINDVGAYTRINIPKSYRLGVELQASASPADWINISGNVALSTNKINQSTEFIDDYDNGGQKLIDHKKKTIAFSPSIVSAATTTIIPCKGFEVSLLSKYVSRQFLDNTQNIARSLKPYYVQDLRFIYDLKNQLFRNVKLLAQVNNLLNRKYEPNGYTFSYISNGSVVTENFYYPMAGTNVMVGVNVSF